MAMVFDPVAGLHNYSLSLCAALGLKAKEMTGRDIPTLLGIFACVLIATALTWSLATRAFEYFLPG